MTKNLTERLSACYTGAVYDVLRDLGHDRCILPREIRCLDLDTKIAGPVCTLRGRPDNTISPHDSLLAWTGFLSKAPSGHVIVCQPQDDVRALMGELSAEALQLKGVLGYIVDGGCRDLAFIRKMGFPVFHRYATPRDVVGGWVPEAVGEPIAIGNVRIANGDYILADIDGIVVIPASLVEEVVARCEEVVGAENLVRKAILEGADPQEAYLKHGKF